ncbi:hypothetical protein BASA61_006036 [Batrachochytrium salamandrivorans]|nr:hypothetical protein BASA60_007570 [Batrachochytrium salamandrivorans]KAH6588227.1 hypothetical protein BASA61_006036 [Batrachochytrium salamandrivorans]
MQFFHLFSFVVAASYAAALPQPAGLSEKYSNSADTNLASGLEARSYQPGSNSYKDSATLVSLKRRNAPAGLVRDDSGPDPSPPPETTPDEPFIDPLTDDAVSSENLASTIDNVGDGVVDFFREGEKLEQKIGGLVGKMVARYLRRHVYVNVALRRWAQESVFRILRTIKASLGDEEYSKIEPELTKTSQELSAEFKAGLNEIVDDTEKILKDDGPTVDNLQDIDISFDITLESRMKILSKLKTLLGGVASGKTLEGQLAGIIESVSKFTTDQKSLHVEIMGNFGVTPS